MNNRYPLKTFLGFVFSGALALFIVTCGGGGDSSSTTTSTDTDTATGALSIEASVSTPTSGSALTLKNGNVKAARMVKAGRITETADEGNLVHCEDTAGNEIGNSCTTDATGTCVITGLTEEQLAAGVVVVSEEEAVEMNAYEEPEADAIEAAVAGTPIPVLVNTESDMALAVMQGVCPNGIAGCKTTVDLKCINEAMQAIVGDDDASADNLGGFAEAMFQAHAAAFQAGVSPAGLMTNAVAGDWSGLADVVDAVGDVAVADAATNFGTMITTMKESYCVKDTTTGLAPWQDIKTEVGIDFDSGALVNIFKGFTPDEIGSHEPEDFRGYGTALSQLTGGFAMFGSHSEARQTLLENLRLGAFRDPTKAGAALGLMASTFPEDMNFTGFDPSVAARAAHNGFLEYVSNAATNEATFVVNPNDFYANFSGVLSDPTKRQSWAVGGSAASSDYISGFVNKGPENFNPFEFVGTIKSPPGGVCTATGNNCLPCDTCSNNICTSLSSKIGIRCTVDADCGSDGILGCVGGFVEGSGGNCMCKTGIPPGAFVHQTEGAGPAVAASSGTGSSSASTTGGGGDVFVFPTLGAVGSPCGGLTACASGLSCSDSTHGVCLQSTFKKGPFAPCSAASECESGSCPSGICAALTATQIQQINTTTTAATGSTGGGTTTTGGTTGGSTSGTTATATFGARANGQPCATGSECASQFCSAGLCSDPPTVFQPAANTSNLGPNGASCTVSAECGSHFCAGLPMTCQTAPTTTTTSSGGTTPTGLPMGSLCFSNSECASGTCDTHMAPSHCN